MSSLLFRSLDGSRMERKSDDGGHDVTFKDTISRNDEVQTTKHQEQQQEDRAPSPSPSFWQQMYLTKD